VLPHEALTHATGQFGHGAEVVAFARPHELDIVDDAGSTAGVAAKISRILAFGVTARVELDGINGTTGQHFEVELTREQVAVQGLAEGQVVRLVPSRLKVFEREAAVAGAVR
jgi:sulfate transport system ATP-binding protein